MGGSQNSLLVNSYSNWWSLAGVTALTSETPAGWLDAVVDNDNEKNLSAKKNLENLRAIEPPPLPEILLKKPKPQLETKKAPDQFSDDWDEFQHWLAQDEYVPGAQWDGRRVLPVGDQGAKYMVITAWPEMDDQRSGAWFGGDAGQLLDNMLAAIGHGRSHCYIAGLAITRPAGGRCQDEDVPEMLRLMRHHIALAKPQQIIFIGNDITQLMLQQNLPSLRGRPQTLNFENHQWQAIAIPHPALLLNRPNHKAAAWDSLKLLIQKD